MRSFQSFIRWFIIILLALTVCLFVVISYAATNDTPSNVAALNAADHLKPMPNTIALTFDDGPDPRWTPQVIAILDKYHIKATFFVIGENAKAHPELIKLILSHGNSIANHTMTHPMLSRIPPQQMENQITGVNDILQKEINYKPVCLRPPYGMYNKNVINFLATQNMSMITWSLNSFDYERPGADKIANWVLSKSKPGYVILMHDGGGNRSQTVAALPTIIQGFEARGLTFSKICY